MRVLTVRNANIALAEVLTQVNQYTANPNKDWCKTDSRNGPVIKSTTPFTTVYTHPMERVSFDPIRDANPIFHYLESLWLLSGREDVAFPAYYAANIANYSDDDVTLNGAYGYRWYKYFGVDQIRSVICELSTNPLSRRCILQMWSAQDSVEGRPSDLSNQGSKDLCCNMSVVFQARKGFRTEENLDDTYLDMTVYNRSNDIVFGAYGANSVHFSVLQEFVAFCVGMKIGTYYQVSNNFHLYTEFPIVKKLLQATKEGAYTDYASVDNYRVRGVYPAYQTELFKNYVNPEHVQDPSKVYDDTKHLLKILFSEWDNKSPTKRMSMYTDSECIAMFGDKLTCLPSYLQLALLMISAYEFHKVKDYVTAISLCMFLHGHRSDWSVACVNWMQRREANFNFKVNGLTV